MRVRLTTAFTRVAAGYLSLAFAFFWSTTPHTYAQQIPEQYDVTTWTAKDGLPSTITPIVQAADGYLWLGTTAGLVRFDGVRFVPWKPASDQELNWGMIWSLCAAHDGSLWVGSISGVIRHVQGEAVTTYSREQGLNGAPIENFLETHDGTIWAGTRNGLYRFDGRVWTRYRLTNPPGQESIVGLIEDRQSTIWASIKNHVAMLRPGESSFEDSGLQNVGQWPHLSIDATGTIYFTNTDAGARTIHPITVRQGGNQVGPTLSIPPIGPQMVLHGEKGEFWLPVNGGGVTWVHGIDATGKPFVKHFGKADGIPDERASTAIRDREGNVWVSTAGGLVRFRKRKFAIVSSENFAGIVNAVTVDANGQVFAATGKGLAYVDPRGRVTVAASLPNSFIALSRSIKGGLWVSTGAGIGRFINGTLSIGIDRFRVVNAMVEDLQGRLWIGDYLQGIWTWDGGRLSNLNGEAPIGQGRSNAMFTDSRGRVWIGLTTGNVIVQDGGHLASYSTAEGLNIGGIGSIQEDQRGTIWLTGENGLARFAENRFVSFGPQNGLPVGNIFWVIDAGDGNLWFGFGQGIGRIRRTDLDEVRPASSDRINYKVYGAADGLQSNPIRIGLPGVAQTTSGVLWFTTADGLAAIDPHHVNENPFPPPVHIESVTVDGKRTDLHAGLRLPPNPKRLQFDYTALSFVAPEKVLFRYRLDGKDEEWQEAGTRRQAFYNDLRPGNYRFRVMACNNDGVWNEAGASWSFSIAPAFYQTRWFGLLCVVTFITFLWGLYRLRLRQVARQFNVRLDDRVAERTRIARELHDTLLQSFQGLMLRFQTVADLLPSRPAEAKQALENAMERADEAIAESRDAVHDLRSSPVDTDIAQAFRSLGRQLSEGSSTEFLVVVEGAPRDLQPIVRDEIYSIGREALQNAFRHAQARHIELEMTYGRDHYRFRIRDDGNGIDPHILDSGQRGGHWGLPGMRERAKQIGATLDIWSRPKAGTEIDLNLPSSIAYMTFALRRNARKARSRASGT